MQTIRDDGYPQRITLTAPVRALARLAGDRMAVPNAYFPKWKGPSYIAGTSPDGLVTVSGTGAVRTVDLLDQETRILLATTVSASNGTYRFDGLSGSRQFVVMARGSSSTENDIVQSQVTAAITPLVLSGSFAATGNLTVGYNSSIDIVGGVPPYSNPLVHSGSAPSGLSLAVSGSKLVLSGGGTAAGTYSFTVSVASSDGQTAVSSAQSIEMNDGHRYWRLYVYSNNGGQLITVAELELRGTIGGSDLTNATDAPSKAFSSTDANSGNAYWMAFDDDPVNKWSSNFIAANQYVGWDFGTGVSTVVREIAVQAVGTGTNQQTYAPSSFDLQYSDDNATWHSTISVTGQTGWADGEVRVFH